MKALFKYLLCLLPATAGMWSPANAQDQEIEQLILDAEKLTQLKGILADMKAGYQIYQQGYGTISNLSKGNFNLHNLYLTGLLAVSPTIRNYGRVADIISQQGSLLKEYRQAQKSFNISGMFSSEELNYISDVYSKLVADCLNNIDQLNTVLTDSKLRMSDAERMKAIDRIYEVSTTQLQFLRAFNRNGAMLSLQRKRDISDSQTLGQLYSHKN